MDNVPISDADEISAAEAEPDMPDNMTAAEAVAYPTPEQEADAPRAPATEEPAPPADPLAQALQERDALKEQLLRHRAEFDNYRKRVSRDMEQLRKTAAQDLLRDLLPVVDNLERALSHAPDKDNPVLKGVEMVMKQFADLLTARGVEPIPGVGEKFDPQHHEALAHQPSEEHPEGAVMLEYERGYRLGEQVLRPARVVVSSGPAQT
jgi:molecular chaperone GrpE